MDLIFESVCLLMFRHNLTSEWEVLILRGRNLFFGGRGHWTKKLDRVRLKQRRWMFSWFYFL